MLSIICRVNWNKVIPSDVNGGWEHEGSGGIGGDIGSGKG